MRDLIFRNRTFEGIAYQALDEGSKAREEGRVEEYYKNLALAGALFQWVENPNYAWCMRELNNGIESEVITPDELAEFNRKVIEMIEPGIRIREKGTYREAEKEWFDSQFHWNTWFSQIFNLPKRVYSVISNNM